MKNLATLKRMNSAIYEARNAYRKAVAENLMQTGELRVKGDDDNEELGYPDGKLLSVSDKHGYLVDCVYDRIKASEKGIEVHICYFDDGAEECWQWADELSFDDLDCIIDGIQWPDDVKQGEAEPEKVWVFTAEQVYDYNAYDVIVKTFATEDAARKYMQDFLQDDGGEESLRQFVERKGWEVEFDDPDLYRAFADGYYVSDHIELTITECNIE